MRSEFSLNLHDSKGRPIHPRKVLPWTNPLIKVPADTVELYPLSFLSKLPTVFIIGIHLQFSNLPVGPPTSPSNNNLFDGMFVGFILKLPARFIQEMHSQIPRVQTWITPHNFSGKNVVGASAEYFKLSLNSQSIPPINKSAD